MLQAFLPFVATIHHNPVNDVHHTKSDGPKQKTMIDKNSCQNSQNYLGQAQVMDLSKGEFTCIHQCQAIEDKGNGSHQVKVVSENQHLVYTPPVTRGMSKCPNNRLEECDHND